MEACHASLNRLQTDYIDVYYAHRFDAGTPREETFLAFSDLVRQGKVLYVGISEWTAEQIAKGAALKYGNRRGCDGNAEIRSHQIYNGIHLNRFLYNIRINAVLCAKAHDEIVKRNAKMTRRQDERLQFQRADGQNLLTIQGMLFGKYGNKRFTGEGSIINRLGRLDGAKKSDVNSSIEQSLPLLGRGHLAQSKLYLWETPPKCLHKINH